MAVMTWRLSMPKEQAIKAVQQEFADAGFEDYISWDDASFSASVGLGVILNLQGEVTDDQFLLEECSGALGSVALDRITQTLQRVCPDGKVE